jgi:gluconolactonase
MACWPPSTMPMRLVADEHYRVPDSLRRPGSSEHSMNQKRGRPLDCFIEGPIIVGQTLYITDIPYGRIFAIDLESGGWSLVIEYDGEPNGLAWHPQRQHIIIADFKSGLLALDLTSRIVTPIATRFNGEHFKGVNDVIVSADGSIFFTDQGMTGLQDPSGRVYRLAPDGRMDVLIRNCPSPNGLVLNKKQDVLFVAMTRDNSVWHIPLYPDGSIQRTGRFSSYFGMGGPDGMTLDVEGNIFVAHSTLGTVYVHRPNGEPLAQIISNTGNGITNLTWGVRDKKVLYITESETGTILKVDWHCEGWLGEEREV